MPKIDKNKVVELDDKTKAVFEKKGYRVQTLLGAGSFGEVYKGYRIKTDEPCAVKMMNLDKMSVKFKQRFLPRELTSLMEIKNEFIVRVWDIFKSNHRIYIFMEYCSNGDIAGYLKRHGELRESRARTWFKQSAIGLNYLHEELLTAHRDVKVLKNQSFYTFDNGRSNQKWSQENSGRKLARYHKGPIRRYAEPPLTLEHFKIDNLLLDSNWNVKITDFGFACVAVDEEGQTIASKTFCGTVPYYSPQIVMKLNYDPFKSDVWALGVVLYAMVMNRFPFHFKDLKQMVKEQTDIDYKTSRLKRELSKELKHLLMCMFEADEKKRPSFAEVLNHRWVLIQEQEED